MFLISIILLAALNILISSLLLKNKALSNSNKVLDIEFGVEYILNEIENSHMLICSDNINTSQWLGLVLVTDQSINGTKGLNDRYSYTTYILEDNNIKRANFKYGRLVSNIRLSNFYSPNIIIKNIEEFTGYYDTESNTLRLYIKDSENKEFIYYRLIKGVVYE